jgi:NAD dependent epimerase/dehydratase family enzyme
MSTALFNLTAPEPVTSRGFCAAMQSVHRSVLSMPVPAAVMRLALGEMADELLISGQRVEPRRLLSAGFQFRYPALEEALPELEKRTAA